MHTITTPPQNCAVLGYEIYLSFKQKYPRTLMLIQLELMFLPFCSHRVISIFPSQHVIHYEVIWTYGFFFLLLSLTVWNMSNLNGPAYPLNFRQHY